MCIRDSAQAFKDDKLGEFIISSYPTEEKMVGKDDFLVDVARTVCNAKDVKRVMVIPNSEDGDAYDLSLIHIWYWADDEDESHITVDKSPESDDKFRFSLNANGGCIWYDYEMCIRDRSICFFPLI